MIKNIAFKLMSAREVSRELGQRLRRVRLSQNMRQNELARRAGVSRLTVVHFEKTGQVSLNSFLRLVLSLGKLAELSALFLSVPTTIAEMEKTVSHQRLRASRKHAS